MKRDFSDKRLYNDKFIPLLKNNKRYNILMGGGGSGKSRFQAQKEIIKTYDKNRLISVRKVKDTLRDSVFAELIEVIESWGLECDFEYTKKRSGEMYIKNILTGSDILFRGMDDPEKVKSVKQPTRIRIEEATELTKEDLDQLDLRLRGDRDLQLSATFNPISDQHRLITDFWNYGTTEEVECVHSTYKDNKFVGQEQYERVMQRLKKQDKRLYDIYALGKPGKAIEGLIFDYKIIQQIPEEAKLKGYGLDFGYNDPTALVAIYEYNNDILLDEIIYKNKITNDDLSKLMQEIGISKYDDIIGDNARPEAIEEIYRNGFNIKACKKGKDSIVNGIQLMKQYDLYITSQSQNIKKEFENYTWAKDKNGVILEKPIDMFNHAIDASRYGINVFFTRDTEIDLFVG